jgi:hypothetical protein
MGIGSGCGTGGGKISGSGSGAAVLPEDKCRGLNPVPARAQASGAAMESEQES